MGKAAVSDQRKTSFKTRLAKDFRQYRGAYLMLLPVLLYYLIFCYKPMFGIVLAFKNFSPRKGIFGSPWAGSYGFEHFIKFFQSYYFTRVLTNTLTIINPVQVSANGMDPVVLNEKYGDKIVFWGGGVDTQHVLGFQSEEKVREDVRKNVLGFKPGGGYIFHPVHNIMGDVPPEQILAAYDEAYRNSFYTE